MLPGNIQRATEAALGNEKITAVRRLSGGSINNAVALRTNTGQYFLKWNSAGKYPGMFEAEAKGLRLLRESGTLYIPVVIYCGAAGDEAFLLLELVEQGRKSKDFWNDFGRSLARMHRVTNEKFGLDHDNYIGSLPQSNNRHTSWSEFFAHERMMPQLKLAHDAGRIDDTTARQLEHLYTRLDELFPAEQPSLLHGDLWSGNYMTSPGGKACIYDPAVYFGHREMDLAMTKLFGGFDEEFYTSYNEVFPLGSGWQQRIGLCNLYPLMVHVNLFGGDYLAEVRSVLRRFS